MKIAGAGPGDGVDAARALAPQPQWCSWLDHGEPPPLPDRPGSFALRIAADRVEVTASSPSGGYYARRLLGQLRALHPDGVPDLIVVDWPDLLHRGVTLDCSRNRVPSVATLEEMFATFGGLRINHVELYLETTYQHPGHDDVWGDRDAYSGTDIERLCATAAEHHIELIGQQNSLGHLEGWLASPRFSHLAALPGGYTTPDGSGHEPAACLEPTHPDSWDLAAELVANMARAFDQPRVHVGLDEPIDLNPAVWDAIFDVPGVEAPWSHVDDGSFCVPLPTDRLDQYLEWVHRLRALPALEEKDMLMWADVVAPHPEILAKLPDGVTLVEWGYEGPHAFDARCGRIAAAGRPFWVAPGTSGWSALGGRILNMVTNVDAALDAAARHGGSGLLVTSWGSNPSVLDWPGFVWAAAGAWNRTRRPELSSALDLAVAHQPACRLGSAWVELGTVSDHIEVGIPETTTVSEMFRSGGMAGIGLALAGMKIDQLDEVDRRLAAIAALLASVVPTSSTVATLREELGWVRDAMAWGTAAARLRLMWPGAPDADELRSEHDRLRERHDALWHRANRHGGYDAVASELAGTLGGI